eukprot:gene11077-23156_t
MVLLHWYILLISLGVVIEGITAYSLRCGCQINLSKVRLNYRYRKIGLDTSRRHRFIVPMNTNTFLSSKSNMDDIDTGSEKVPVYSYIALGLLLLSSLSNQWSRQVINYLCDFSPSATAFKHVNIDLGFSQASYAALSTVAFSGIFILFSFIAGRISDLNDRRLIIAASCLISSLATGLQGFITSFDGLIPLRALIGASQAFTNPAAFTLISDYFPKNKLGQINGIYSTGIYLGGGLASISILIDNALGWRSTLFLIAIVGICISFLNVIVLKDPRIQPKIINEESDLNTSLLTSNSDSINTSLTDSKTLEKQDKTFSFSDIFQNISQLLEPTEVKLILIASLIRFIAGITIGTFKAPFVLDKFPSDEILFSTTNAFIVAGAGFVSSLFGGYLSDLLADSKREHVSSDGSIAIKTRARTWVPGIGSLVAAPLWAAFILAPTAQYALAILLVEYLAAECWFGPTLAALFSFTSPERRGTAQGLFSILTALGSLGPIVVGALTEGKLGIAYSLGDSLIWVVSGAYLLSGLLFVSAAVIEEKK